jgi:hypothetical protein
MPFVVKVTGAKELRKAIRQLEDAAAKKGMQADLKGAYRTAARAVEVQAKMEAPRRSGRLAGSIKAKGTTTGASIVAGGLKSVPYAGPIHYGWPSRPNKSKGWRGGPIKANPFLTRAAAGSIDIVRDVLADELQRVLDKVMPGG